MNRRLVAVYGTLKKGYYNYNVYLKGYEPIYYGLVKLNYTLYSNGRYPMIIKSEDLSDIFLEVYEVDDVKFDQIYALEEPFGYHYDEIEIPGIKEIINVFVFSNNKPPEEFHHVPSGNWKPTIPWDKE